MGLTPQREAKAASERRRSGLLLAVIRRAAAVSGPMPNISTKVGAVVRVSRLSSASKSWILAELTVSAGKGAKSVLCRRGRTVQSAGTEALTARDEGTGGEAIECFAKLGRSRDNQGLDLVDGLGASLDSRVPGVLEHTDHFDFAFTRLGSAVVLRLHDEMFEEGCLARASG